MSVQIIELTPEQLALAEKVSRAAGFDSVESWISFLISEKVGHTSFWQKR